MTEAPETTDGTAAAAMADVLVGHGVDRVFTVPGESFLPLLEAFRQRGVDVITCRHEGGAAFMAQAQGRLTGRPGVCLVSRAPGATNGSIGIHEADQAGTPMIMIVGQVTRPLLGLGAFQEIDLPRVFAGLAKDAVQEERPEALASTTERVWRTTVEGRPGPVVLSVPTDVLRAPVLTDGAPEAAPHVPARDRQLGAQVDLICSALAGARRPAVIVGGGSWSAATAESLRRWAEASNLPVVADFRCQDYLDNRSPAYVGDLGNGPSPRLRAALADADVVLCLGSELGDMMTQGYTLFADRRTGQQIVQVVADPQHVRNRTADVVIGADVLALVEVLAQRPLAGSWPRSWGAGLRAQWEQWTSPAGLDEVPDLLAACIRGMSDRSSDDTVVTVGAGNYTAWVQRFWHFREYGTQVAPRSGSMGYSVPAAVSAALAAPERPVVAFAGDGCFLMTAQELATAARYGAGLVNVVVNNGVYGTIRMHQERHYPSRVVGTDLTNPDFVGFAESFGCWAARARTAEEALAAYDDCLAHPGRLSLIEIQVDPDVISPTARIDADGGLRTREAGGAST